MLDFSNYRVIELSYYRIIDYLAFSALLHYGLAAAGDEDAGAGAGAVGTEGGGRDAVAVEIVDGDDGGVDGGAVDAYGGDGEAVAEGDGGAVGEGDAGLDVGAPLHVGVGEGEGADGGGT